MSLLCCAFVDLELMKCRLAFGGLYWALFAKVAPKLKGYRLEDRTEVLDDGTTITKVAHVPI